MSELARDLLDGLAAPRPRPELLPALREGSPARVRLEKQEAVLSAARKLHYARVEAESKSDTADPDALQAWRRYEDAQDRLSIAVEELDR